jgi:hypothetical protein
LDHDYLENMYGMFKKVNGKFVEIAISFRLWDLKHGVRGSKWCIRAQNCESFTCMSIFELNDFRY